MLKKRFALSAVLVLAALSASSGEEACRAQSQSYSRCRLLAANGLLIPPEEIRADEWINYMEYRFPDPPLDADHQGRVGLWGVVQMNRGETGSSAFALLVLRTAPYQCQREQPVDLAIVLDRSGSMIHANKMEFARKGIQKLLTGLTAEDRVGLLGFNTEVSIERNLSAWKPGDDLSAELQRLGPAGGTDLNQGLLEGMKMLQSAPSLQGAPGQPARAQRLLVITDAQTNTGELDTERVVKGLEPGFNAGIRLTAIGVGLDYNDALLSRLTRIPGNNGRFLDRADEIGKSLQTLFDALLPLEVDKPQLSLELPANVTVKHSFGTTFTQQGRKVSFPKLTSMGCDDYQLVLLQLDGTDDALRQVAGSRMDFEAWSPMEKRTMRFGAEVGAVDGPAGGQAGAPVDEGLASGLYKATTVALAADALRRAAENAKAQDFAGADKAVTEAERTLNTYDPTGKDREIGEIRAVVMLDRQVLQLRAQAQLSGAIAAP